MDIFIKALESMVDITERRTLMSTKNIQREEHKKNYVLYIKNEKIRQGCEKYQIWFQFKKR